MECKICYKCNISKPLDSYYKSSIEKRDYICKQCSLKRGRQLRKRFKDSNDIHTRYMYAKNSAKTCGKPFLLSEEEYRALLSNPCYYCNLPIKDYGIGLDRINNDKTVGYILSNVLPCCGFCNKIRGNSLTVEETKVAIDAVINFRKSYMI